MPRATIASRQLKNKDTGLDLTVPTYRETKGLMSSTVHYQVVLVSNMACFKTPSHKESEVVQYSIEKQWSEFEELRVKVAMVFHDTSLPALNKISIIVSDQVLRQRRNNLDQFVKFMASVPRLATCVPLLEFLGVDPGRARRYTQGEPMDRSTSRRASAGASEDNTSAQDSEVYDFEDSVDDQTDGDLFDEEVVVNDEALFGTEPARAHVSMFEQQDMKAELNEEDEKDFSFIPDAIITKRETIRITSEDTEANSDLFTIEDDLDKLMTIDVSKQGRQTQREDGVTLLQSPQSGVTLSQSPQSVVQPGKPSPAPKPAAKPSIVTKHKDSNLTHAGPVARPAIAKKPKPALSHETSVGQTTTTFQSSDGCQRRSADNTVEGQSVSHEAILAEEPPKSGSVDTFGQDDILKYLRENSTTADDVDLFS